MTHPPVPARTLIRTASTAIAGAVLLTGCGGPDPSATAPPPAPPAAPVGAPPFASAALPVTGLQDGTTLVSFTTADPTVTNPRPISGLASDTRIVGIDNRVKTGDLLGVGDQGGLYTIADTGAATSIGKLSIPLEGQRFGVDVNPAADALRIVSDTGQNLRQPLATTPLATTVADTALTNPAAAPATGTVPAAGVTAAAYTNDDTDMATATTLFVIDTKAKRLAIQSPANAGTLAPVGGLGEITALAGFDIHSTLVGGRTTAVTGWASLDVGGTRSLHSVDLLTARLQKVGDLPAGVIDIALPVGP